MQITSLMPPSDESANLLTDSNQNDSGLERSTDGDIVQIQDWSGEINLDETLAEEIRAKIR